MNFSPMSPQEILESMVLPNGIYPFRVKSAVEKKNAGGKPYIEIYLTIQYKGRFFQLRDILTPPKRWDSTTPPPASTLVSGGTLTGSVQAPDFVDRRANVRVTMMPDRPSIRAKLCVRLCGLRVPKRV